MLKKSFRVLEHIKLYVQTFLQDAGDVQAKLDAFSMAQYKEYCKLSQEEKAEFNAAEKYYCKAKLISLAKELKDKNHPELDISVLICPVLDDIVNGKLDASDINLVFNSNIWVMLLLGLYAEVAVQSYAA